MSDAFWEDNAAVHKPYLCEPLHDDLVRLVEQDLGYKLPAAYVALMRTQNGGVPKRTCFPTTEAESWAEDHVALTGIFGIGSSTDCSLCGKVGSKFMIDEWGYPPIGVYFADCPSAGHDMFCLDYRDCGPDGEPAVVHVDQESDFKIVKLADDFQGFIDGLKHEDEFL